jgi:hypothetical protein
MNPHIEKEAGIVMDTEIALRVNGTHYRLSVDTRTTLLYALRERLGSTDPKKGCDHGHAIALPNGSRENRTSA